MPEITANEYLSSLLVAYQNAEKIYSQAVSDLVAAEIRRDEAKKAKDEAFNRLEEARGKYSSENQDDTNTNAQNATNNSKSPPRTGFKQRNVGKPQSFQKKGPNKSNSFQKGSNHSATPAAPAPAASVPPAVVPSTPNPGSKKAPKIFTKNTSNNDVGGGGGGAGGAAGGGGGLKKKLSKVAAGPFSPFPTPQNVLEICKGRSREWFDENFDCESVGLVKKFYQASFGTKTHEKTKKVSVFTIVLNDDWNDLVNTTAEVQEMYIGKNTNPNGKPTLRDRAAEALVKPPQREPVALFFAPKNRLGTNDIFYGGHWKVVDGKMLVPPRAVKGQDRQCLAKFSFVGVDQAIVDAINQD